MTRDEAMECIEAAGNHGDVDSAHLVHTGAQDGGSGVMVIRKHDEEDREDGIVRSETYRIKSDFDRDFNCEEGSF